MIHRYFWMFLTFSTWTASLGCVRWLLWFSSSSHPLQVQYSDPFSLCSWWINKNPKYCQEHNKNFMSMMDQQKWYIESKTKQKRYHTYWQKQSKAKHFMPMMHQWKSYILSKVTKTLYLHDGSQESYILTKAYQNTGWPIKRYTHILGFYSQITRSSHLKKYTYINRCLIILLELA